MDINQQEEARAALQAGEFNRAEGLYRGIIQRYPSDHRSHHFLGLVYYQQKKFEESIASIDRAIQLDSSVAQYFNNKGKSEEALSKFEIAASCVRAREGLFDVG